MSMKKVFPPRLCEVPGCERVHMARGLCGVHYHMDLSWTGVKCKFKNCKKGAFKKGGFCETHRKIVKQKILRKKKLCVVEGCGKSGCVKKFIQDGREMYATILKHCFEHQRRTNESAVKCDAKKRVSKKSCKICHSKPAELCVGCREEKG